MSQIIFPGLGPGLKLKRMISDGLSKKLGGTYTLFKYFGGKFAKGPFSRPGKTLDKISSS